MKTRVLGAVCALGFALLGAVASPADAAFNLVWSDDFNGALSSSKWNNYTGQYGSANNCYFMPSNAFTYGGNLVLVVNTAPNNGGKQFTSGGVDTAYRQTQTYGKWEVRAKFAEGYGISGYIGLFPANGSWPPEIDFAEVLGREYWRCYVSQHYGPPHTIDQFSVWNTDVGSNFSAWHTYTVEWTPRTIKYYVDGVLRGTQTQRFTAQPMKIALGTGTGDPGTWVGSPNDAVANGWTWPLGAGKAEMKVDYVKIYSYSSSNGS